MSIGAYFNDSDFVDADILNSEVSYQMQGDAAIGTSLHTAGCVGQSYFLAYTTGMQLTLILGAPFGVLFGTGQLAYGHGTTNGTDSGSYALDLSSFVPSTGSVTVYVIAQEATVYQGAHEIVGPPVGNPDFSPNFIPYIGYSEVQDTLAVSVTTTVPDNFEIVELCRVVLDAGQSTLGAIDTSHQVLAGAVLSRSGEVLAADLGVGVASANVGALGGVLTGTLPAPGMAHGAAAGNIGALGGVLTGTLPAPGLAHGAAAGNIGALGGVLTGTLPTPGLAPGAAAQNIGLLGGVLTGTLPNPGFAQQVILATDFVAPVYAVNHGVPLPASSNFVVQVSITSPTAGWLYALGGHNVSGPVTLDSAGNGIIGTLYIKGTAFSSDNTILTQWHQAAIFVSAGESVSATYEINTNGVTQQQNATLRVGMFFIPY